MTTNSDKRRQDTRLVEVCRADHAWLKRAALDAGVTMRAFLHRLIVAAGKGRK